MISTIRSRLPYFVPFLASVLVAACGGGGGGSGSSGPGSDKNPPSVIDVSVGNGATNVPVNTTLQATFSEPVKNVGPGTFQLKAGTVPVNGSVTLAGNIATFTPDTSLAYETTYTATVTTGITDLANNALGAACSWSFTTGTAPDTTRPTVSSTTPPDCRTWVAVDTVVRVTFSEPVKNVGTATFQLKVGTAPVPGSATLNGATATFTPSDNLAYGTTYTATLTGGTAGISDLANNTLEADNSWSFTTARGACLDCHGGAAGSQPGVNGAPVITKYWQTSGHGRPFPSRAALGIIKCEDCHDIGHLSPADHKTDGTAGTGPPPANVNTSTWPGKTLDADNRPTANTAHLRQAYFPTSATYKYNYARAFDRKCGDPASGCHRYPPQCNHSLVPAGSVDPADNVLRFGDSTTVSDPKAYFWYPACADFRTCFYESRSPWEVEDLTTSAAGVGIDNGVKYGTCISCHDPHGTGAAGQLVSGSNAMLRGDFKTTGQSCNGTCHTSRPPP